MRGVIQTVQCVSHGVCHHLTHTGGSVVSDSPWVVFVKVWTNTMLCTPYHH